MSATGTQAAINLEDRIKRDLPFVSVAIRQTPPYAGGEHKTLFASGQSGFSVPLTKQDLELAEVALNACLKEIQRFKQQFG